MGILHTVNKSPFEHGALDSCLHHVLAGASILLLEDGVYAAVVGSAVAPRLLAALDTVSIYALEPDLLARGIGPPDRLSEINVVDYAAFVELAVTHSQVVAWR